MFQNKIRVDQDPGKDNDSEGSKWLPIREDDSGELDEMLSNGVNLNGDSTSSSANADHRKRLEQRSSDMPQTKPNGCLVDNQLSNGRQTEEDKPKESVFKSANWLSDSELIFSLTNQVGGLVRALRIFQELDIGIKHVESRKSKRRESEFEIFVDIDCSDQEKMKKLVHHLR